MTTVDVCVVGFGLSCVPLLRELDLRGIPYRIISEGDSIWDKLDARGRLDFDLVSSYLTSFFSFELDRDKAEDYFPTAREFHAHYRRRRQEYEDRILADRVVRIENGPAHSLVITRDGLRLQAKHVVIATGFSRSMQHTLATFDFDIRDKTVLFDIFGDHLAEQSLGLI